MSEIKATRRKRVQKVTLTCEVCSAVFEVYPSVISAAEQKGRRGPRFCSSACRDSTHTGPKCSKCGGTNTRGSRFRVCQACLDSSPGALKAARARQRLSECPSGRRWCSLCDEFLPPAQFASVDHVCIVCLSQRNTTSHRRRNFGITDDQYDALLVSQGGACAICRTVPKKQRLHVDHNHRTGVIRGLLCLWCNHKLLGGARERVDVLRSAIAYLSEPPASAVIGEVVVPKKPKRGT